MPEISGVWKWNDVVNITENPDETELQFYCSDFHGYRIWVDAGEHATISCHEADLVTRAADIIALYRSGAWLDTKYKTMDFGTEPQTVSEGFYTLINANAQPVPKAISLANLQTFKDNCDNTYAKKTDIKIYKTSYTLNNTVGQNYLLSDNQISPDPTNIKAGDLVYDGSGRIGRFVEDYDGTDINSAVTLYVSDNYATKAELNEIPDIPTPSTSNNGKVLGVTNGNYALVSAQSGPAGDDGRSLYVNASDINKVPTANTDLIVDGGFVPSGIQVNDNVVLTCSSGGNSYICTGYLRVSPTTVRITSVINTTGATGSPGTDGQDGADGAPGAAAGFGTPVASVDNNVGTPSVTISASGPNTAKIFNFAFHNLKGATGANGSDGQGIYFAGSATTSTVPTLTTTFSVATSSFNKTPQVNDYVYGTLDVIYNTSNTHISFQIAGVFRVTATNSSTVSITRISHRLINSPFLQVVQTGSAPTLGMTVSVTIDVSKPIYYFVQTNDILCATWRYQSGNTIQFYILEGFVSNITGSKTITLTVTNIISLGSVVLPTVPTNYVTTNTEQEISAKKTFTVEPEFVSINITSDKRLKKNIKSYKTDKSILDLDIKEFEWKDEKAGKGKQIGILAQDLQEYFPELVVKNDDGYLHIRETKLVYLLMQEVKQLKQEVEELRRNK